MGSGSKTLAVNLGFLACEDEFVIEYMKILSSTYMFTNAINPIQASTALTNLRIISGEHGKNLRKEVMSNYTYIKGKLEEKGYKIYGQPCPALPLHIGNEILCRLVVRDMMDLGTSLIKQRHSRKLRRVPCSASRISPYYGQFDGTAHPLPHG